MFGSHTGDVMIPEPGHTPAERAAHARGVRAAASPLWRLREGLRVVVELADRTLLAGGR